MQSATSTMTSPAAPSVFRPALMLWSAPEVLEGRSHSSATDVHSLAVVLWEIASGRAPFAGLKSTAALMRVICSEPRTPAAGWLPIEPDWPPAVQRALQRAWAYDPAARATAAEVAAILREGGAKDGPVPLPAASAPTIEPEPDRPRPPREPVPPAPQPAPAPAPDRPFDPAAVKSSADLCFVVDCTGSMQPWIDKVRDKVLHIADDVHRTYPNVKLRVAFVGYRDLCDRKPLEVLPFTENLGQLRDFVKDVKAIGGGDIPEDVLCAFEATDKLDWRSRVRLMVHITDAPTHGLEYHDAALKDDYPGEHPKGFTAPALLQRLGRQYIDYCFLEVPDPEGRILTRKMTAAFARVFDQVPNHLCPMMVRSLSDDTGDMFQKAVSEALIASITTSVKMGAK